MMPRHERSLSGCSVCAVYGDEGATCSDSQPCRPDLGCVGGKCGAPSPVGTTCQASTECDQLHGDFCVTAGGTCTAVGYAAPSQACGLVNGQFTLCTGPGSTCAGVKAPTYTGQCVAPASDGAGCDVDGGPACGSPAVCVAGHCQLPSGASCH